ncbi:VOC family protein [Marinobacterium mangrovicola]|uniref:Glyoxalase/bleomycin resistance protein/dioxygenase superfamily protein n=1 Tax=Marinobacterium mangrovicola TaxID=1476959 RepID=A0A4R1GK38_9GAMM|nr:VOC family protein [Marinobacterium mangrovicola]TCK07553.1 glyoxalase/bleomycin resistance protein/dioxygenase superfamily protein [Marinobacterium mangrovicola]
MKIIGPDALLFGVDDLEACTQYLTDYGLTPVGDGRFEAMDGTAIVIAAKDDTSLPADMGNGCQLRKTLYGVADEATLNAIAEELGKDREVSRLVDGSIESVDDMGFTLGFQLTIRRDYEAPAEVVHSPGSNAPKRELNELGVDPSVKITPRSLSHLVYFVPDGDKAEAFYRDRLGFRVTDRLVGAGPFMQPGGTQDHHTLFMIQAPEFMRGLEHFTFHFGGPTEVMLAGSRMVEKGYQSFWGPGRHQMGSNWFWYFNSPFGARMEMDADMDLHDEQWVAREIPISAEISQAFLFQYREKWIPGPGGGK